MKKKWCWIIKNLSNFAEQYDKDMKDEFARLVENNYAWKQGKKEVARNMLDKGLDPGLIAECTGLSNEEINALQLPQ